MKNCEVKSGCVRNENIYYMPTGIVNTDIALVVNYFRKMIDGRIKKIDQCKINRAFIKALRDLYDSCHICMLISV